jgi:hypothetical protein
LFYVGHEARGAKSNHKGLHDRPAALFIITGDALLASIGDAPIKRRRWDNALAALADYRGPLHDIHEGIDLVATKRNPDAAGIRVHRPTDSS